MGVEEWPRCHGNHTLAKRDFLGGFGSSWLTFILILIFLPTLRRLNQPIRSHVAGVT